MSLTEIAINIVSDDGNNRKVGLADLTKLKEEEQKTVIRTALEFHKRDDMLFEYRDSCEALSSLIYAVKELGYVDEFREEIKDFYNSATELPTKKAQIVARAAQEAL